MPQELKRNQERGQKLHRKIGGGDFSQTSGGPDRGDTLNQMVRVGQL
jgi:hypothetical protein